MKSQDQQLAVVIPAYKGEYLAETLASLANQTNKQFTCYISNDASPDDLADCINSFSDSFSIRYHRFDNNLGGTNLAEHWVRSIELVQNEQWIWLLCDDDVPALNCVEEFYSSLKLIETQQINVLRFKTRILQPGIVNDHIFDHPVVESGAAFISRKLKGLTRSSLSEHIFRASSYRKNGFINFPLAWHTDDAAWISFSESGGIYTNRNAIVEIRISENSISGQQGNILQKYHASMNFTYWLIDSDIVMWRKLSFETRQCAYYNVESYVVNRMVKLNMSALFDLWKLRVACVGLLQSFKVFKLLKTFIRS